MTTGRLCTSRRFLLVGLALFCGLFAISCGGGSSEEGQDTCQPNGHIAADGTCICLPGYKAVEKTCVKVEDGDPDADSDTADKDPDPDPDSIDTPDTDTDTQDPDPDTQDGDKDTDDAVCSCPLLTGTFCIDPLISNPNNYKQIVVKSGLGCTLNLQVTTALQVVFTGDVACDAQGRETLSSLGCVLTYKESTHAVLLFCDPNLYSFSADFCPKPDGDSEEDVVDPDPDPDTADQETDAIDPDEADSEEIELVSCQKDDDCPAFFNCQSDVCRPGCNLTSSLCTAPYVCDQHGYCLLPDGDVELDIEGVCSKDDDCSWGNYCNIPLGTTQGLCKSDCSAASPSCPAGKTCYYPRGICNPDNICTSDSLCGACYTCNTQGQCVLGCCETAQCGACQYCNGHTCLPDPACATDGDGPECQQNSDCLTKHGAGWFCNEGGACEELSQCNSDSDAIAFCGVQHYCQATKCKQDCCSNVACAAQIACPQNGQFCNYYGHCEGTDSDSDYDSDPDPDGPCTSDTSCATGTYCYLAGGYCTWDCQTSASCLTGFECSNRGKCVAIDGDADPDTTDADTTIHCKDDDGCPSDMYCNPNDGTCISLCGKCGCNLKCDSRGRCNVACTAGQSGCGACEDGDLDTDTEVGPCTSDAQCTSMQYCNTTSGQCTADCVNDTNCAKGYSCVDHGRCVVFAASCASDLDCPRRLYCNTSKNQCAHDCVNSGDCANGYVCDARGHCTLSPGATYTFAPCSSSLSCPPASYCGTDSTCTSDCLMPNILCPAGDYCTLFGTCEPIVTPDGDPDPDTDTETDTDVTDNDTTDTDNEAGSNLSCTSDCQCMRNSYCSQGAHSCTADCLNDSNCATSANGHYCDPHGYCTDTPGAFNPSCVMRNITLTATPCTGDAECPEYAYCAVDAVNGNYCRLDCYYRAGETPSFSCPSNQTCSLRGRCQAKR